VWEGGTGWGYLVGRMLGVGGRGGREGREGAGEMGVTVVIGMMSDSRSDVCVL